MEAMELGIMAGSARPALFRSQVQLGNEFVKMAGVGGAAVPGRLSLAGTEARPTELFSYKSCSQETLNIHVILNGAQLRYESRRLKNRDSSLRSE
ncbi:MAG: hypothetical protein Q7O12_04805 [Deltaproteobacteria bacterium]|nr:hypothetical protein [Deltaproteobacteria bacterium]